MDHKIPAWAIWQEILIASLKFGLCVFLLLFLLFTIPLLFFPAKAVCDLNTPLQCIVFNFFVWGFIGILFSIVGVLQSLRYGFRAYTTEIEVSQEGLKRISCLIRFSSFRYFSEKSRSGPTSLIIPWHTIHGIEVQKEKFFGFESEKLILICPSGMLESCSRMRSRNEVEVHLSWPLENLQAFKQEVFQFISEEHPFRQFLNQD